MEILLGLLGLAGVAILVNLSGPLPSEAEYKKALERLGANPVDPDQNTIVGKYLAFVVGDYSSAMPYLVHSSDKTLSVLADHELDPTYTDSPIKKIGMADEWVAAARKFPALNKIFYSRASKFYTEAWPDLSDVWKIKAREQGNKLSASRPQGGPRKALPSGWASSVGLSGRPSVLDGTISRTGSYSVKLVPGDEKVAGAMSSFKSDMAQVSKGQMEVTAYVRSDGTDNGTDRAALVFFDSKLGVVSSSQAVIPIDTPFWTPLTIKAAVPENAIRVSVEFFNYSKKGNIWVDDVSMKFNGKEILKNGSFEDP